MKYFKPTSVSWWSGLLLIATSIFSAVQSKDYASIVTNPHTFQGLGLIGLRGAINPTQ